MFVPPSGIDLVLQALFSFLLQPVFVAIFFPLRAFASSKRTLTQVIDVLSFVVYAMVVDEDGVSVLAYIDAIRLIPPARVVPANAG